VSQLAATFTPDDLRALLSVTLGLALVIAVMGVLAE